jgi:acyl transferase domain-containing protein
LFKIANMPVIGEPIAVIGTGCRFPGGSSTPSKLWHLLREPRDVLEPLAERFDSEGWFHENGKYHGHSNVKKSYQLSGIGAHRHFDAQFFGINAVEANTMDPQMRLLLETLYEALEVAGQPIENLRGSNTAVYTGVRILPSHFNIHRDPLQAVTVHYLSSAENSSAGMKHIIVIYADKIVR